MTIKAKISILDNAGNVVVKYTYDAWGNCTLAYESSNSDIGRVNPIRYRSYYYDKDTKLYYLNARYYNPAWRRFISPDDTAYLDPETPNGLNLYAYCYNDPVNYVDPSGHSVTAAILIGIAIGAIAGGTIGGMYAYDQAVSDGATGLELYLRTANGITKGAVLGGLIGGVIGNYWPLMGTFLGSSFNFMTPIMLDGVIGSTVAISVTGAELVGAAAVSVGIMLFSKASSGPIRYSDGTGIDPTTGKPITDKKRAYEIYHELDNTKEKLKWKKWMKGKGWRTNHLK